jgi:hypothetical protein
MVQQQQERQWFTPMTDEQLARQDCEEYYKQKEWEDELYDRSRAN